MVKSLERGQKFLVPLPDGKFIPGYVVHQGRMFTLVNIFRDILDKRAEPKGFEESEILMRDWLIGDHVFSRSKKVIETPWVLYRTKKVDDPLPPSFEGIIEGGPGREYVVGLESDAIVRRPPNPDDFDRLPKHAIRSARYYSLFVEAALNGKQVVLDEEKREYVISD